MKRYLNATDESINKLYDDTLFDDIEKYDNPYISTYENKKSKKVPFQKKPIYYKITDKSIEKNFNEFSKLKSQTLQLYKKLYYQQNKDTYNIKQLIFLINSKVRNYIRIYLNEKKMNLKSKLTSVNFDNISASFYQLWEIYILFPELIPENNNNIKNFNCFHLYSLPGPHILATERFIDNYKNYNYNWVATGFNPSSLQKNEHDKYERRHIKKDSYSLISSNKNNFTWGINKTGEISNSSHIKWFKNKLNPIDLVTSNMSYIGSYNTTIRLRIGEMLTIFSTLKKGGNCVLGTYIFYVNSFPDSINSTSMLINYLYTYSLYFKKINIVKQTTSLHGSFEFMLVCENFKGISQKELNDLYYIYDNYNSYDKFNCWIKKSDIPKDFIDFVLLNIKKMYKDIIKNAKLRLIILYCHDNLNNVEKKMLQCKKYLDLKYIYDLYERQSKLWIKNNHFV